MKKEIEYVQKQGKIAGPKNVLVIGASTGYGLASRIVAAFGSDANTIGVASGRPPTAVRTGNVGYYTMRAFDNAAREKGLIAESLTGDAFSHEIKDRVVSILKKNNMVLDCVVYSLAASSRRDPDTGELFRGSIKPIGRSFTSKSLDAGKEVIKEVHFEPATKEDIAGAVKVMGGEDWELWMNRLSDEKLLTPNVLTVAYSYIGPPVTAAVYREGTLGMAKKHLEATGDKLHEKLSAKGGRAFVAVNKALVTRSSAVIPVVPLYISALFKVMKEKNIHEGCIEQMFRLFHEKLYKGEAVPVDELRRIRMDDWELREDVQKEIDKIWNIIDETNYRTIADFRGYEDDFLQFHGFGFSGIDYSEDVDIT